MFPTNSRTVPDSQLANAAKTANIHDKLWQRNLLLCQNQSVSVTERRDCRLHQLTDDLFKPSSLRKIRRHRDLISPNNQHISTHSPDLDIIPYYL